MVRLIGIVTKSGGVTVLDLDVVDVDIVVVVVIFGHVDISY